MLDVIVYTALVLVGLVVFMIGAFIVPKDALWLVLCLCAFGTPIYFFFSPLPISISCNGCLIHPKSEEGFGLCYMILGVFGLAGQLFGVVFPNAFPRVRHTVQFFGGLYDE